ncbi:transcription factor VIP1 [Cocos nucifera]|uniref:Transcription factor VIP1 n=1 Tax=Cocos nucifera TaxID=13894 RepID=A0A8K0II66_COCNU|nr:transcription factor VIP1 [Cocos nucifera]
MEETESSSWNKLIQRQKSSAGTCSSTLPKLSNRFDLSSFNSSSQARGPHRQLPPSPSFSPEASKRPGIPPAHPTLPAASPHYPQIPSSATAGPSHSRSLSQPAFFNLDSFASLSPRPPSADAPMEDRATASSPTPAEVPLARSSSGDGLPPRKAHRRSQSDIPFGFFQSSLPMAGIPPPVPQRAQGFLERSSSAREGFEPGRQPPQFVKQENEWERVGDSRAAGIGERKPEGDLGDDPVNAYINLDSLDALNSLGTEEKREDLDSRASGTKMNAADSSENESESSVNESHSSVQFRTPSTEKKEGTKRSSPVDPSPINLRHCTSISMDSFMGKLHFGDESPKLPPSLGNQTGQHSRSGSMDGTSCTFSLEFGNGEFSAADMQKIMVNGKLAEIALTDPKRVKRCEFWVLRDSAGLTSQNNELKFRLQAMEQQAQLRDGNSLYYGIEFIF